MGAIHECQAVDAGRLRPPVADAVAAVLLLPGEALARRSGVCDLFLLAKSTEDVVADDASR
jgi:hypothetical protein